MTDTPIDTAEPVMVRLMLFAVREKRYLLRFQWTMRKKALIVDDHPLIFEAICQALLAIGFGAAGVTNDGIDALRMIEYLVPRFAKLDIDR